MTNTMTKAMVTELNSIAYDDWKKAKTMLEGINLVLGTNYGLLNRRVVYFDKTGDYATAHDLWANL